MKKTLITLALVAVSAAAFAQGKVTFGNDSLHLFVIGSALPGDTGGGVNSTAGNTVSGAPGAIPMSPLPSGKTLQVSLYAGTSASSLALRTTISLADTAGWGPTPGRMVNKTISFADIGFSTLANFQIIVTDTGAVLPGTVNNGVALSFADFGQNIAYFGTSGAFTANTGSTLTSPLLVNSPSTWFGKGNLVINSVPEPSSMALAGLGAASLLIFRRRK